VEHFGAGPTLLLTMRRDAGAAAETSIRVPLAEGAVALDPLNGACETLTPVNGIASLRVRLNAGAAALRVVAPWTAVPAEAAFLKAWTSGAGEAAAAALNLRACIVESESGVAAELQTVEGRPRIRLINRGDGPAIVSDIRWSQGAVLRTFSADPRILAAGESVEAIGEWPAPAGGQRPWIEVRWRTQRGAQSWAAARAFHAADETPLP